MNFHKYLNGKSPKKGQDVFNSNVYTFLSNSQYKYAVLRGGMGLGKCLAMESAILEYEESIKNTNSFTKYYIATPSSATKESWGEEFHYIGIKPYSPWIGKAKCLAVHGEYDCDFSDCKECDLCKDFLILNNKNAFEGYTEECEKITEQIRELYSNNKHKNGFKTAQEYYNKIDKNICIWHPIKNGIMTSKIVLGSYQASFSDYFDYMTGYVVGQKRVLILDEAQNLDRLFEEYFSLYRNIDDHCIDGLKKDLQKYINIVHYHNMNDILDFFVNCINEVKIILIEQLLNVKYGSKKYSYIEFEKIFNNCSKKRNIRLDECIDCIYGTISQYESNNSNNNSNKEEDGESSNSFYEFLNFLVKWKDCSNDNYFCHINLERKKTSYKDLKINPNKINYSVKINHTLIDKKLKIKSYFNKFHKIIFMSGTIGDEFLQNFGIDKNNLYMPDEIKSYSLKDYIKIFPFGDYTTAYRHGTIQEQASNLIKIVDRMEGRVIIFLPSMANSEAVTNILTKTKRKANIFSTANKGQEEKVTEIKNFMDTQNSVLLFGLRQDIEGQNLKNEDEYDYPVAPENIIFLGFPFAPSDPLAREKMRRFGNNMPYILPTCYTIHQNAARSKRYDSDVPCIVCMGIHFSTDIRIKKYIHPDFYPTPNKVEYDMDKLLNWITSMNNKRKLAREHETNKSK